MKFVIIIFLLISSTFANIARISSHQGNIWPIDSTNISMVEENVNINLEENKIVIYAKFWMYNNGDDVIEKVGFPLFHRNLLLPEISKFWCKINGKEKKIKIDNIELNQNNVLYYWFALFPANDTTVIEVGYECEWGFNNMTRSIFVSYLIGTARTWNGPIGKGKIVFDHSNFLSKNFVITCEDSLINSNIQSFKHNLSFENITVTYKDDFTIFTFEKYKPRPTEKISISFVDFNFQHIGQYEDFFRKLYQCERKNESDLNLIKNEILARKGYIFEDKYLHDYFGKKKWYKPDSTISFNMLPAGYQAFYNLITKLERVFK